MTMALFILILIFSLALYTLFSPLFSAGASSMVFDDRGLVLGDLLQKKQGVLDDMRELEWDRQVMKLEKNTFDELYEQGLEEGATLLQKISDLKKRQETSHDVIPAPANSLPGQAPAGILLNTMDSRFHGNDKLVAKRFCTQCGNALAKSDKFCSQCGVQS